LTRHPNTGEGGVHSEEGMVEMTQAQRDAIRNALNRWTEEATVNRQTAREHLIRDGFYTEDGKLAPPYGGKVAKSG
jgi:hypothetical protein